MTRIKDIYDQLKLTEEEFRNLISYKTPEYYDTFLQLFITLCKEQNIDLLPLFNMVLIEGEDDIPDFYMGKFEVTQELYELFMGNNPSYFKDKDDSAIRPVESVSYNMICEFLEKLNSLNILPKGQQFDIPSVDQWMYAAKGGKNHDNYLYAGSNNINEVAWYDENSGNQTHPVGQLKPNSLGLYDMCGNVWEYCKLGDYK